MEQRPLLLRTFVVIFVMVLFVLAMYPLRERDYYQVFGEMLKDKKCRIPQCVFRKISQ